MTRTRSRKADWTYKSVHKNGSIYGPVSTLVDRETFFESFFPGSNNCVHWKSSLWTGEYIYDLNGPNETRVIQSDSVCPISPLSDVFSARLAKKLDDLDWDKIPTSSQFGVIQLIAELDETLSIFSVRFWREFSYGSFEWGLKPFIADLKNILKAVQRLGTQLDSFNYETERNFRLAHTDNYYTIDADVKVRFSGKGDVSFQNEASLLLDRLGFHPDLATAWDLVPLSFVVDYLLPIGDFLESFRGGGWVKAMVFSGWETVKIISDVRYTPFGKDARLVPADSVRWLVQEFTRTYYAKNILTADYDQPVLSLQVPSFTQLFNMLYLFLANRK